jgi:hypothetical protein
MFCCGFVLWATSSKKGQLTFGGYFLLSPWWLEMSQCSAVSVGVSLSETKMGYAPKLPI